MTNRLEHRDSKHKWRLTHRLAPLDRTLGILAPLCQPHIKMPWFVRSQRYLVGARRMGSELTFVIPPKLFSGQPAHPLNECALHLPTVNRRVERAAHIMQNISARDTIFACKRINLNF